jgi:hypothetical protein
MSTTQRLLDAQGIPSSSFVNLVGGSDSLLPDTAGLARTPGASVSDLEQIIDNQLGNLGAAVPIEALRDPYGNIEPDGDELTDPKELSELPTVQGLAHQIPDIAHSGIVQAANAAAGQVGCAAGAVGGAVGLSHTVGDIVDFAHAVSSSPTLELAQRAIDWAAHSIDQGVTDVAGIGMNGHILVDNLINDAPGELLNGLPVNELVGRLDHALAGLNGDPLVDVSVFPNGVLGSSAILHATVDPAQGSFVTIDALAAPHCPDSHLVDADALPKALGDIANVSVLTSPDAGEGAIGAVVGNGPSLLDANLLTGSLPNACNSGQLLQDVLQESSCGPAPSLLGQITNIGTLIAPATGDGAIGAIVGNCSPALLGTNVLAGTDQIHVPNLAGAGADALAGALNHDLAGIVPTAVATAVDLVGANSGTGGTNCVGLPTIDLHEASQQLANASPHVDIHSLV